MRMAASSLVILTRSGASVLDTARYLFLTYGGSFLNICLSSSDRYTSPRVMIVVWNTSIVAQGGVSYLPWSYSSNLGLSTPSTPPNEERHEVHDDHYR